MLLILTKVQNNVFGGAFQMDHLIQTILFPYVVSVYSVWEPGDPFRVLESRFKDSVCRQL